MPLSAVILFCGSTAIAYLLVGHAYAAALDGEARARALREFGFVHEAALAIAARRSALRWPWDLALRITSARLTPDRMGARRNSNEGDRP